MQLHLQSRVSRSVFMASFIAALSALASGADGLEDIRSIIDQAPARLKDGGWLLFEHGWDQAEDVARLMQAAGFEQVQHRQDLAGIARCTGGCRSGKA